MKTIAVCTDFSPAAENALQYAALMARENNDKIVLFYLQQISIHALNAQVSADYFYEQTLKSQKKMIEKVSEIRDRYSIQAEHYLASGNFFEGLESCIRDYHCEVVVMGMTKKTFEERLMGNTVTQAIHRVKKPVFVIPDHVEYTGIKKILFAYDAHKNMTWSAMNDIYNFAGRLGSDIEIFNVNDNLEDFAEVMNDTDLNSGYDLDDLKYRFKITRSKEVIKAIDEEIRLTDPDMVIMIPYRYPFPESLFHRSKTAGMAYENRIPLLSIPLNID